MRPQPWLAELPSTVGPSPCCLKVEVGEREDGTAGVCAVSNGLTVYPEAIQMGGFKQSMFPARQKIMNAVSLAQLPNWTFSDFYS